MCLGIVMEGTGSRLDRMAEVSRGHLTDASEEGANRKSE